MKITFRLYDEGAGGSCRFQILSQEGFPEPDDDHRSHHQAPNGEWTIRSAYEPQFYPSGKIFYIRGEDRQHDFSSTICYQSYRDARLELHMAALDMLLDLRLVAPDTYELSR